MRTTRVLVVSAIAHAPFVLLVADAIRSPRPRPRSVVPALPRAPSPATPFEVAFFDEPSTDTQRAAAPHVRDHRAATGGRLRVGTSARRAAEPGPEPGVPPNRPVAGPLTASGSLRMRGANLQLGDEAGQRMAADGTTDAHGDTLKRSGRLESAPGGRGVVRDRVTTMRIDADGKVHFDDKKDVDLKLQLPIPRIWDVEGIRRDLGRELTEWFKDPEASTRFRPTSDLPRHLQASQHACDQWGATFCDDPLAPKTEERVRERKKVPAGFVGGPMDITAWLHRKYVGDPYSSRKLKLLDATRDERVAMGERHRAQQQARSSELMRKNLERLWATERDQVARRAALFQLWDECTDDEAGARARAIVIGWIRAYLPEGSPDAYTAEELSALQAHKSSSAVFAPYRD